MNNKTWIKQVIKGGYLTIMATILVGCAAVSETAVKKQVSFDKNCPIEQVKVKERKKFDGRCNFEIEACGKNYTYQAAPVVFEKGKEPTGLVEQ